MSTLNKDLTFNVAHGRVAAFFSGQISGYSLVARVFTDANILAATNSGADLATKTDAVREATTLAALKTVQADAGFAEKTLSAAGNSAPFTAGNFVYVNSTLNQVQLDADDWAYAPGEQPANGTKTGFIAFLAKPTSSPTDANTIPLLAFVYEETVTGSTLNILVPTGGFYSAADNPAQ